jgi:polar amino acid transport system substrate-binding protein
VNRLLLTLGLLAYAQAVPAITFVSHENPPFNYLESGQPAGLAYDTVAEMARRAKLDFRLEIVNASDADTRAQKDRNTCHVSVPRLASREKLFQWIGPIATNRWAMFGTRSFEDPIKRVEDLRRYRIGGVAGDPKLEYLAQYAVIASRPAARDASNPPRLFLPKEDPDRIDLWITGAFTAQKIAREAGVGGLRQVYVVQEIPLYVACNPGMPRAQVDALAAAYEQMKRDGMAKRIGTMYLERFAR